MAMLLCAGGVPNFASSICRRPSASPPKPLLNRLKLSCSSNTPSPSSVNMAPPTSAFTAAGQIVEHIVLFKVKPGTDPSKVNAMVDGLNGLTSLDQVLHLTAGPVLCTRSASLSFTHMLHSRYRSRSDLDDYSAHSSHVGVVTDFVRPIIEDVMALDWFSSELVGPLNLNPGSAMRMTFLKLKENLGEKEKDEILSVIGEMKSKIPSVEQISFGENFSFGRDKGFSICSIAVFPSQSELKALDSDSYSELVNSQKQKVKDLLEGVVVVDYVVPQQKVASPL